MSIFGIRHKNKRSSAFCSKRTAFCVLFLVGLVAGITAFVLKANAQLVPVASVEIFSEHTSFANNEPGAWKVTKSAEWTDVGKARITFEVATLRKFSEGKKLDVVMVIDNSGSMGGSKLSQVKTDSIDFINTLLNDPENSIALITFSSEATIRSGLTNDRTVLLNVINDMNNGGTTNYYDGLHKASDVLNGYEQKDDHELVLLFLTDGYPNEDTPNETAEYIALKKAHPYLIVNGIQYEMGEKVLQPIIDISDNQFIANIDTLNNVLFDATIVPYSYDNFTITDYLDDTYWTIANQNAIKTSTGEVDLSYDGTTPKVTWTTNNIFRTGAKMTMAIDIELKGEFYDIDNLLLPTNKREVIESSLPNTTNEHIDSTLTPILKDTYRVLYDANTPSGCVINDALPSVESHTVFSTVEIPNYELSCPGYSFKGWYADIPGGNYINDDYFRMPERDVNIIGIWARPDISKSMNGTPHQRATATLLFGSSWNSKMKQLAGQTGATTSTSNNTIVAILRADTLPPYITPGDNNYYISTTSSQTPIYAWFDNGTIYYYSEADDIFMSQDARFSLSHMEALENIDGLKYINTSNTTNMSSMFQYTNSLRNIDALSNWNMSKVDTLYGAFWNSGIEDIDGATYWDTRSLTTMHNMFGEANNLQNIDGAIGWNTSNVTTMDGAFYSNDSLENIDGAINWDTHNVTDMKMMFTGAKKLADICGASRWNVSNVTDMSSMFSTAIITSVNCLSGWDVSKVTDMSSMFYENKLLSDISGLSGWNTERLTDVESMFHTAESLTNIDALANWKMNKVTTMQNMFRDASELSSVSGASSWNTDNVTNMAYMFYGTKKLKNIDSLGGWNVEKVTTTSNMFSRSGITSIASLTNWKTGAVTNMNGMFSFSSLASANGSENWNTENVTSMSLMFYNSSLANIDALANWETGNVKTMNSMFGSTKISNIDALLEWDVSSVTTMDSMFQYDRNLQNVSGARKWKTQNVTDMGYLFYQNTSLSDISGLAGWNTSNVNRMTLIFAYDPITNVDALATWDVSNITDMEQLFAGTMLRNVDGLLDWDVSNVKKMTSMFFSVPTLQNINGLRKWETDSVTDMSYMFGVYGNNSSGVLSDISGVANWETGNVTRMAGMFQNVGGITDLDDLAGWDVSSVTDMSKMFRNMSSLKDVQGISGWTTTALTNTDEMFYNDTTITSLSPLNSWDASNITNMTDTFFDIPTAITRPFWYHE